MIRFGKQPRVRGAQRTTVDGETFHSKREARRYQDLRLLERAGEITNLQRQVRFPIKINGELVTTYVSDFTYEQDGKVVVEDSKGWRTDMYKLKKILVKASYGIDILET